MQGELEINLRRPDGDNYPIDFRFSPPGADSDETFPKNALAAIKVDDGVLFDLSDLLGSPNEYGKKLGALVFANEEIRAGWTRVRAAVQASSADCTLRVRLYIDPAAAKLHDLNWEALRDADGQTLFLGERVWFSRYLSSDNWQPVTMRAKSFFKALVVISNPSDLQKLAPVDVAGEKKRAESHLKGMAITYLGAGLKPEDGPAGPATLANISAQLRNGFDVLYMICHGSLKNKDPLLWLETDDGKTDTVAGAGLAQAMLNLQTPPRLAVLASCQSAAGLPDNPDVVLSALGPRLAQAGIPAVIAMHGKVSMETVAQFMPVFFDELQRDGQIDRAVAVARGQIAPARNDHWMPVLFMRLRSGAIWYVKGFASGAGGAQSDLDTWDTISAAIEDRQCTPILGPGVIENIIGSTRDIARRFADRFGYPIASDSREDFPTIAQYLMTTRKDNNFPRREFRKSIIVDLLAKYGPQLPPDLDQTDLNAILSAVGVILRKANPADPHRVLASKPFEVYITANPDHLMEDALVEAGKNPRSEYARWNSKINNVQQFPTIADTEPDYRPNVPNPLVYHLFGRLNVQDSLVLAEDDYFDYLLRIGSKAEGKNLTPARVGTALVSFALLFVGFRLDDWSFRVLLRSIYSKEGSAARTVGPDNKPCVGAQMLPDGDRTLKPGAARRYFETYLSRSSIDIYWGSVEEFVQEFQKHTT